MRFALAGTLASHKRLAAEMPTRNMSQKAELRSNALEEQETKRFVGCAMNVLFGRHHSHTYVEYSQSLGGPYAFCRCGLSFEYSIKACLCL